MRADMRDSDAAMVDVVVMDHDAGVLDAVTMALAEAGLTVAGRLAQDSVEDLAAFLRENEARVVVYDLGPPPVAGAVEKWRSLCEQPGGDRAYVITTTYPCKLEPHRCIVDSILIRSSELDDLIAAVRRAVQHSR